MRLPWVFQDTTLRVILGLAALAGMAVGLVIPFLTLTARDRGVSLTAIGIMASSYLVTQMFLQLPMGAFSDRVGRAIPIALGMLIEAIATAGFMFADSALSFILLRVLQGVGVAILFPAMRALVADITPIDRRGQAYAAFGAAFSSGMLFGPLIGGIVTQRLSVNALFLGAAGAEVVVAICGLLFLGAAGRPQVRTETDEKIPFRALLIGPLIGAFILSFTNQIVMGLFSGIWSIYLADRGANDFQIGLSFTTFSVAFLLAAPIGGRLADSGARWRLLLVANTAIAVIITSYGLIPAVMVLILLGLVEGAFATVSQPSLDAYLAAMADPRMQGRVQGAFTTVGMAGAAISALLGAVLYEIAHVVPFIVGGVLMVALTVFAVFRFVRPAELQGPPLWVTESAPPLAAATPGLTSDEP